MKRILGTFAAIALLVASPLLGSAATGSWSVVSSPNNGTVDNLLQSVTCVTPGDCWAVGYSDSSNPQALTEHWNGSAWSIVSSPSPGSATQLYDVSCSGSADCWAVGTYVSGVTQLGFAMHWNGTAWTDVSLPSVSGASGVGTTGVWCVTASDCWLVGSYDAASSVVTLVEHWNGSAWSIVTTPTPPSSTSNVLSSVTCVSASRCWAVGETVNKTLVEQWDGTAWTIVPSANLNPAPAGIDFDNLYRVTCVSATDCWAVGAATGNNLSLSLILRWDGTSWTVSSAPSPGTGLNDELDGVACQGANLCWATGGDTSGVLVDKWNGSSWSIDTTAPSPGAAAGGGDYLYGAVCDTGHDCWAVGASTNSVPLSQTLVEEYTSPVLASAPGPTPTATPAPSASPTPSPVGIISAPNTGAAPGDPALAPIEVGAVLAGLLVVRRRWRR